MSKVKQPAVIGTGPVGRAVIDCLRADGHAPIVISRSGGKISGCQARAADITDVDAGRDALGDADVVFHCAQPAYHRWPEQFPAIQAGVLGAAERAEAGVVAVDNTYAYGRFEGAATEDTPLAPVSRKGAVRATLATELLGAHEAGRVRTAAVRASDFFGPRVEGSVFGERFFEPLMAGKKPEMYGDLDARHSIAYVPDIARAMVTVAGDEAMWGRAWHAPTAPAGTQREFLAAAAAAAGVEPAPRMMRGWQLRIAGVFVPEAREQLEMLYEFENDYVIDSTAMTAATGLVHTPLPAALAATVAWYRTGEAP